jgi:putative DNA methylase
MAREPPSILVENPLDLPVNLAKVVLWDNCLTAKVEWPMTCLLYGLERFEQLFSPRQLLALTTFSDLINEMRERIQKDAVTVGHSNEGFGLESGGNAAKAYAEAVCTYLAFALSRVSDYGSTICTWRNKDNAMRSMFSKQAISMTWDYAEGSPFGESSSGFLEAVNVVSNVFMYCNSSPSGSAVQGAAQAPPEKANRVVSTDPPPFPHISA